MKDYQLMCTSCHSTYEPSRIYPRCCCNEPLEVKIDLVGKRIMEGGSVKQTSLERYFDFLPLKHLKREAMLNEGFTALVGSEQMAETLKVGRLLFKNETQNPTWSFKDRGTAVAIQHALSLGYGKIGTVSTGNMAASVAAYGNKAGLKTYIFVNEGIAEEKLAPVAIYGAHVIKVRGEYDKMYDESLRIGEAHHISFLNSDVPWRVEGSKTIAYEICEQLDFKVPDFVLVPTSSGGNVRGIIKGFEEFYQCGLIEAMPTIVCVQASGCSPIYNAYIKGAKTIERFDNPHTMAHAIGNPYPPSGNQVLRKLAEIKGMVTVVEEGAIIPAQKALASLGIFGQPASAVPLAAVRQLQQQGILTEKDTVVCLASGSGLKHTSVLSKHHLPVHTCNLEDLSAFIGGIK